MIIFLKTSKKWETIWDAIWDYSYDEIWESIWVHTWDAKGDCIWASAWAPEWGCATETIQELDGKLLRKWDPRLTWERRTERGSHGDMGSGYGKELSCSCRISE